MKYGSVGFDGCDSEVAVVMSLRSGLVLLPVKLIDELPTYKSPNQQNPPGETRPPNIASVNERHIISKITSLLMPFSSRW